MIFDSNIFGEPTCSQIPLAEFAPASGLEWSLDGVTWTTGFAPANVNLYFRVTAPAGVDVSGAAYFQFTGPGSAGLLDATAAGQVVTTTITGLLPAGIYDVSVLAADATTVLYDGGNIEFS